MPSAAPASAPVDRLIEVEKYLRAGGYAREAAALAAVRNGESSFETALGLIAHGGGGWRRREQRKRRDRAYVALAELIAGGESACAKADAVERAVRRYQASADWRHDQRFGRDGLPPGDPQRSQKFDIMSSGVPLLNHRSLRRLFEI